MFSLSSFTGTSDGVRIEITDRESGKLICEMDTDFENIGKALVGRGAVAGDGKVYDVLDELGKEKQTGTLWVKVEDVYSLSKEERDEIAKNHFYTIKSEGKINHNWKYGFHDIGNPNQYNKELGYPITIVRYVDAK